MHITNEMIHPELRKKGKLLRRALPYFSIRTFRLCNQLQKLMKGKHTKELSFEEIQIDRPHPVAGKEKLRICVYRSKDSSATQKEVPGLLWIHGGGYAIGAPYPAALEDCYTALLWLKNHAAEYGIRSDQLIVGGDSAGGGLTAALTIYARDKKEVSISFQMPLYPMLDDRMLTESSKENDAPVWNTKSNENGWKLYLGELYGTHYFAPQPGAVPNYR